MLVFNKLIRGTAPQLAEVLRHVLTKAFDEYLSELLSAAGITRKEFEIKVRNAVDQQLEAAERDLRADPRFAPWRHVPEEFINKAFVRHRGQSLLRVFREPLRRRAAKPLALIDLALNSIPSEDARVWRWIEAEVTGRVIRTVRSVIYRYLSDTPHEDDLRDTLLERAEDDLVAELEESKSVDVVGRFDGDNTDDREAHRRNFNRRHNPFLLLVGQVGEEGIDLQEQCRYVVHYDLEWNPARMEQREGRVDRMGWGRQSEGFIDVRFLLLKGTYEERTFHTVMQRDEWFQILMGSKRRELGEIKDVETDDDSAEISEHETDRGRLTAEEKAAVMLDLRPE